MTKRKAVAKIIWIAVNLLMFVAVSVISIHRIVSESTVDVFATLSIVGTGYACISGLLDIWVAFPDYMRALSGLNKS